MGSIGTIRTHVAAARRGFLATLIAAALFAGGAGGALADSPTPLTETPTAGTPTSTPTATATATSTPTATPRPTLAPARETRKSTKPRKKRRHHTRASAKPTSTPTVAPALEKPRKHHRKRSRHKRASVKPTSTPTVTPTPTPTQPITLQTEDSIKPVSCNGPAKPLATRPFLYPPYDGWNSIVSYFDHDSPTFLQDGLIITAAGLTASPDRDHRVADFPAYWNRSLRQYVYYDGHNGYDYDLWYQPVHAAASGKVIYAGMEYSYAPDHGYGNMVMIKHRSGYVTLYGHFSRILVKTGQKVKAGQKIGISGNTGHSSGPHLHFTVFHNCTPTDPYGWAGSGQDPLADYQGETSIYLWVRPPLVVNPSPHLPGLSLLPSSRERLLVLLKLPSTRGGTNSFTASLRREALRALEALGGARHGASIDMLRGALDVSGSVSPARLYALPGVASIATTDAAEDARADVLSALARAALLVPHRAIHLGHSRDWTAYVFQWQGRTILAGRGPKAKQVKLRVIARHHRSLTQKLQTDPGTGAYAVDLGTLSRHEVSVLTRQLEGRSGAHTRLVAQPVRSVSRARSEPQRRPTRSSSAGPDMALLGIMILLAAAGAAAMRIRERSGNRARD